MATNIKNITETSTGGNSPEKKFRAGAIAATVWKNTGQRDGKEVEFRTVSVDRVYKDKNDAWQHTSSMRLNDLPRAAVVIQQAYEYLVLSGQGASDHVNG